MEYNFFCLFCHKGFMPHRIGAPSRGQNRGKYCSVECFHQAKRITKICENCESNFTVRKCWASRRFCSRICRIKWYSQHHTAKWIPGKERLCKVCGNEFLPKISQIRKGSGKFCSNVCFGKSRLGIPSPRNRRIQKNCLHCSKQFITKISPSMIRRGKGKYCSTKCSNLAKVKHSSRTCEACGTAFTIIPSYATKRFCSYKCRGQVLRGAKNQNWTGGPVALTCESCSKPILRVRAEALKSGHHRFCSRKCVGQWNAIHRSGKNHPMYGHKHSQKSIAQMLKTRGITSHIRPNKPEQRFIEIIQKYNLPYKYTGNGSLAVFGLNPDFKHIEKQEVVEIFGEYWHSPLFRLMRTGKPTKGLRLAQTLEGRKEIYAEHGYKLRVLWDNELNDEKQVLLRLDMEHKLKQGQN